MISALRGTVLRVSGSSAVIEVGGVGFDVTLTPAHTLSLRVGHEASVVTSLIVREDSLSLFGFVDHDSLDLFILLTGVTGVGPKSAMGVLAELSPAQIAIAVAQEDDAVFRKVSGIGPKTAKLIVLSLAGKVAVYAAALPVAKHISSTVRDDVLAALVGLGWNEKAAEAGLDAVLLHAEDDEAASVQALLRLALTELGPRNPGGAR
ncbi:ATP-dependent DNA helicase RuvA [Agreia sp. Leaf244]|uniref:Holliday junction branch migration protein RuvA n=1 Tax=Agreia sp. Leaf244 TaxID=1736305 RepID=UPI0006F263D8|nr:Holliday junction branch migration protein RuvA [Agreia sp. Leaf244]KQO06570.1 ATP-dependent DNA helicase RuvA [Agreia sp. Leaf244]